MPEGGWFVASSRSSKAYQWFAFAPCRPRNDRRPGHPVRPSAGGSPGRQKHRNHAAAAAGNASIEPTDEIADVIKEPAFLGGYFMGVSTTAPRPVSPKKRRGRIIVFRLVCVATPVLAGLSAAETYFRLGDPSQTYWTVDQLESTAPDKKLPYTFDADLGYRPVIGGEKYDAQGTQINDYALAKRPGVCRVLFLGDSVTARGKLIAALAARYGAERFEYWNAGVEGFDASQEVLYFDDFSYRVRPDHVVLAFHNNDFTPQTVADFNNDGCITFYGAECRWSVRLPWLVRQSEFVRWAAASRFRAKARASDRVEQSLRGLADRLARDGIPFSVILLPIFQNYSDWSEKAISSRERSLTILKTLRVRSLDMLPAVEEALDERIDVCESPGDTWHPSDAVCDCMARQLFAQRLLEPAAERMATDADAATDSRLR
jgi:hypothetical protein